MEDDFRKEIILMMQATEMEMAAEVCVQINKIFYEETFRAHFFFAPFFCRSGANLIALDARYF